MDRHSEVSLWKKLDELQPSEPVAGSARAVVEAPNTQQEHRARLPEDKAGVQVGLWCSSGGSEAQKEFRSLLPASPKGFFGGLLHNLWKDLVTGTPLSYALLLCVLCPTSRSPTPSAGGCVFLWHCPL